MCRHGLPVYMKYSVMILRTREWTEVDQYWTVVEYIPSRQRVASGWLMAEWSTGQRGKIDGRQSSARWKPGPAVGSITPAENKCREHRVQVNLHARDVSERVPESV